MMMDCLRSKCGYPPFSAVYMLDMETGEVKLWPLGNRTFAQEPCFCPRDPEAPEADGYLIFLVCDFEDMVGKLVILDTKNMQEPEAVIRLPFAARYGVHGWWVDDSDIDMHVMPLKTHGPK
ncbi:hypothetical protein INS49_007330 [Diaporthe citri]|uniref:uncharacterized protein n=1 Tax=Diaporthe citri TaxID=83186 RepID=UPI001C81A03A|nr:uncharacterized protein INS49_007330 [Diaporthe citri]KAG6365719.1 hypothetical protein INS49_007330 [Diaporthe citri]